MKSISKSSAMGRRRFIGLAGAAGAAIAMPTFIPA
jgi:hypothetical protein